MIKKNTLKKRTYTSKKRYHKNITKRSIHKKKKNIKKMFGGMLSARDLALMKIGARDEVAARIWADEVAPSYGYGWTITSDLPKQIIHDSIKRNIFQSGFPDTINSLELTGRFFHGIKQRVITLMQILETNGIGSQHYLSEKGIIIPGILSSYKDFEKKWISFGIMHYTPTMNTYCENSIFFVNKDSRKALELKEGKMIGIQSHMIHEYYLETFLSLDELILCIDSRLAVKNISELESPFTEHKHWDPNKKKEVIRNILQFFRSEFSKLSSSMPTLPASSSGPGYDARLMKLYSKPSLSFVDDFSSEEEFKRSYIGNLLKLVNYIRHHLNPSDKSEITEITIYDFISLLLRYYNKDIQILKVDF